MNERNLVIISDKNQNGLAVLGYNIQSFNAILDKYLQLASVRDNGDDFHGFVTWTDLRFQ